jgi:hypothetical protein
MTLFGPQNPKSTFFNLFLDQIYSARAQNLAKNTPPLALFGPAQIRLLPKPAQKVSKNGQTDPKIHPVFTTPRSEIPDMALLCFRILLTSRSPT